MANTHGVGILGERSGTVFNVFRFISSAPTIKCVLLENSPNIVNRGVEHLLERFHEIGWKVCWSMFSAAEIGGHIKRKRWFAMACAPGYTPAQTTFKLPAKTAEPPRFVLKSDKHRNTRNAMLGNSVYWPCVAFAYATLTGMHRGTAGSMNRTKGHASWSSTTGAFNRHPFGEPAAALSLLFKGGAFTCKRNLWPSPTKTIWELSATLTPYRMKFLSRCLAHEVRSKRQILSLHNQGIAGLAVNPEFVEWLMGYPSGWTMNGT
jgi:site-specific DNA-cytosine methylase